MEATTREHGRRLPRRTRRIVLITHVVLSVGWLGTAYITLALTLLGRFTGDGDLRHAAYLMIGLFDSVALLPLGIGALVTGVVLGLGTRWGVVTHWWVVAKLVANLVLITVPLLLRTPNVHEAIERTAGGGPVGDLGTSILPPGIATVIVLILATVISYYKPWGPIRKAARRTRRNRRAQGDRVLARVSSAKSPQASDAAYGASTPR